PPPGLSQQGKEDLDTFKEDITKGASADQINADYAKLKNDITVQQQTGPLNFALGQFQQKAEEVANLASIRDQLQQGPPPQDLPLPTGQSTFVNNPDLPAGQMVVLGPNTVLIGGGGLPIPQGASFFPMGGAGGNVAVWTGTMADLGVPVQGGIP